MNLAPCLSLFLVASSVFADEPGPYRSVGFLAFPPEVKLGPMSAVAIDAEDRIFVLHRGTPPLVALDKEGKFVRAWGDKLFKVPHGLRIDRAGHIWTTDN